MTTVLLTRPANQSEPLRAELERRGATVLLQPTIEILPPESWDRLDDAVGRLTQAGEDGFDWLLFSSGNGVRFFAERFRAVQKSDRLPESVRVAVVGPGTDSAFRARFGRGADLVPELFTAEGLLEKLLPSVRVGTDVLHCRADRGRDLLKTSLCAAGADVEEVVAYRSVDVTQPDPSIASALGNGKIEWITVTSSAIATSLVALFGAALRRARLLSISPITTATLVKLGYPPHLEAPNASMSGIVDALFPLS